MTLKEAVARRDFGAALNTIRKARRLKQRDVALVLGCSHWRIGRIEAGLQAPTLSELRALVDLFGDALEISKSEPSEPVEARHEPARV